MNIIISRVGKYPRQVYCFWCRVGGDIRSCLECKYHLGGNCEKLGISLEYCQGCGRSLELQYSYLKEKLSSNGDTSPCICCNCGNRL